MATMTQVHDHHAVLDKISDVILRALIARLQGQLTKPSEYHRGTQVFGYQWPADLDTSASAMLGEASKIVDGIVQEIQETGCSCWSPAEMPDVGGVAHWSRKTDPKSGLSLRNVLAFDPHIGRSYVKFEVALN